MKNQVKTTPKYWDCECKKDYIHPKTQLTCAKCGAGADEQPDSRVDEVRAWKKSIKYRVMHQDVVDGYVRGKAQVARLFTLKKDAVEFVRNHRFLQHTDFFYTEKVVKK
jgi:hypothetical protein